MFENWRRLLSFFPRRERFRILALLAGTTFSGLLQALGIVSIMPFIAVLAQPDLVAENEYLRLAYETFGFGSIAQFLVFLGLGAMTVLLATNVLVGLTVWLTFRVCYLGACELARRLLRTYLTTPYTQLLHRNSAELLKVLVSEIDRVVIGTLMAGIGVFADAVTTVFIVTLLLWVNPLITIVTFLLLLLAYAAIYLLLGPRVSRLGSEFANLNTQTYKNAHEALSAIREIKVRGCEEHFVRRFADPLLQLSRNRIAYKTLDIIPAQSLELIAFGGLFLAAVLMVGRSGRAGEIVPMLAMFAFAAYRLIPAMKGLFDGVEAIRYNMAALEPLWRDQSALAAPPARGSGRALPLRASIRLEDVHFRYPGGREMALAGIDLEIRPGTACCLVGPTGAGKSTTLDVIIGLLHPDRGRVLIDGLPLTPERLPDWQRSVGYVPQTVYLFDDTVTHNIALGVAEQDIDHACVEHAARIAELHDFIVSDLPQGYATLVGERGANLSGGQRQRIGIARALYHNPALLVLDEATNGLDLVTQGRVLAALRGLPHKTLVIATHRRSVAASCDDIAVLENGRIVARGSFAALTAPDSSHRALLEQTAAEAQP